MIVPSEFYFARKYNNFLEFREDYAVLSLQDFKLWNTVALTTFLSLRKKSINGSFDTLAARAFAAYEEGAEVDPVKEHIERSMNEYKQKLQTENEVLQDPIDWKTGWFNENDGLSSSLIYTLVIFHRFM
ncbi:uncharacterized protein LOC136089580 [Hydra vulgaris]|uniref:Uncharacterized protein LOC136089580 n=1 Tax=Hydra vulgaris TaxID=6087 RepID=A0ABM4DBF6_HYDVU